MLAGISEEEFKAMHTLKTDKAPPRQGVHVAVGGGRAYLALPKGRQAPLPAVLVIHEWWGLNEHIEHWADRLAALGYAALAVDLYGGKVATNRDEATQLMRGVQLEQAVATLRSAHEFVLRDARVQAGKTAALGWCFGGAMALQAGLNIQELDAVVMYYGRPVTDVEKLKALRAPLLGVFGNKDRGIPPRAVDEFEQALRAAGCGFELRRYDAEHAFANPSSAAYDELHAAQAYAEVKAFLAQRLGG